jgi:glutathione S-transferase
MGDNAMPDVHFKLFHDAALRSSRVKWLLHELLDDDFDLEYVDIYGAEQYCAEYLRINPNHAVPTLKISWGAGDSMFMIESAAMIALLADTFPDRNLAPDPRALTPERADYLQILHFSATMDCMLWQIRLHEHILPDQEKDDRTIRRYQRKFFNEVEPQLLERLRKFTYICGDAFSAADCVVGHVIMWARAYGLCQDDVFGRYLATIAERPAYLRAFSDRGKFVLEVPRSSAVIQMVTG